MKLPGTMVLKILAAFSLMAKTCSIHPKGTSPAQAQPRPNQIHPVRAQPRPSPSLAQARSGNLEIWDPKSSRKKKTKILKSKSVLPKINVNVNFSGLRLSCRRKGVQQLFTLGTEKGGVENKEQTRDRHVIVLVPAMQTPTRQECYKMDAVHHSA